MTNQQSQTSNPVDALEQLLQSPEKFGMRTVRESTFYGPKATFQQAVSDGSPRQVARVQQLLPRLGEAVSASMPRLQDRWERLRQLSLIRVGSSGSTGHSQLSFNPDMLAKSLSATTDHQGSLEPIRSELEWFQEAIEKLRAFGYHEDPCHWSAADWRLVSFVQDTLELPSVSDVIEERTPIFLANEKNGKVLWFVAERLPGPPGLITPHWWRLGLVPLGDQEDLVKAVHSGFRAFLDSMPETRCQIRWWLEAFPGGGWHEAIDEAASVQVSAACVARALCEQAVVHPLLDSRVGVSATLPANHGVPLKDQLVGLVGYVEKKIEAAGRAGILTFLLKNAAVPSHSSTSLCVQRVETFDEAYEAMLAIMRLIREYKKWKAGQWGMPFLPSDRSTATNDAGGQDESVPGDWVACDTHEDFIDAGRE